MLLHQGLGGRRYLVLNDTILAVSNDTMLAVSNDTATFNKCEICKQKIIKPLTMMS